MSGSPTKSRSGLAVRTRPDQSDGSPVSFGGPENLFNGGLSYSSRRFSVHGALRCGGEARGVQGMGGPATSLDGWCLVDAAGSLELTRGFGLVTRISNLFDTPHETFDGRPMFGRVATLGLRWRWGGR